MRKKYDEDEEMNIFAEESPGGDMDEETGEYAYDERFHGICSKEDSLYYCLNEMGKVDVRFMAWLAGCTPDEIIEVHGGRNIFQRPPSRVALGKYSDWLLEAEYVRGNIVRLLDEAVQYNAEYPGEFEGNVRVLKERMPMLPLLEDVYVGLGATWLDKKHIASFIKELLKLPRTPEIAGNRMNWEVRCAVRPMDIYNTVTYGTPRMTAVHIIEHILNASSIKVRDKVYVDKKPKMVINQEETFKAQEKEIMIREEFQKWLQRIRKEAREEARELLDEFYDSFAHAMSRFNGSALALPGLNPAVQLHPHQKNAVMRILLSHNTLLCHDVGAGKTYAYIAAVHELYRLGLSRKNLVVVPNVTFRGTVESHRKLYPEDRLLLIGPEDFKPGTREEMLRRIREEDVTAIYMAYSKYDMLAMTPDYTDQLLKEELQQLESEYRLAGRAMDNNAYKAARESIEKRYARSKYVMDERGCFDLLGITGLVIDECQNYKNITFSTNIEDFVGKRTGGSTKADRNLDKVRFVQKQNGWVVFATGTVLTNSISDLYCFQRYLQPKTLKACRMEKFGEWISNFGVTTSDYEVDVHAQSFRKMNRISKYCNLPSLMSVFSEVCDFYHIKEGDMELPEFRGFTDVVVDEGEDFRKFNGDLILRTEVLRGKLRSEKDRQAAKEAAARAAQATAAARAAAAKDGKKKPKDSAEGKAEAPDAVLTGKEGEEDEKKREKSDSILRIISDGRKAALDVRLVVPDAELAEEHCKAGACAKVAAELYHRYPGCTQIIFCDFSTPKKFFNVYDETKKFLMARGIPEKEIAFIHDGDSGNYYYGNSDDFEAEGDLDPETDSDTVRLLRDFEEGKIRIMIGSTTKLGVGVNVQKNLVALHHLDAPWRPADLIQREGRLIRQGNLNPEVFQYRYVTHNSFDAYVWQILENKQKFIGTFMAGSIEGMPQEVEEIDRIRLSMAEVKSLAVGNPLLRDRIELSNRLEVCSMSKQMRERELYQLRQMAGQLPNEIDRLKQRIREMKADYTIYARNKEPMSNEDREFYGEDLLAAMSENYKQEEERLYDPDFMGFRVILPRDMYSDQFYVYLESKQGRRYKAEMKEKTALSAIQTLLGVLNGIPKRVDALLRQVKEKEERLRAAREELEKGNPFRQEWDEIEERLNEIDQELGLKEPPV